MLIFVSHLPQELRPPKFNTMKKSLALLFGLLIACLAVYAVPKELDKVPLKIKIEIVQDAAFDIATVTNDIQIDIDDGVMVNPVADIKCSETETAIEYIVLNSGPPLDGYRRWFNPASNENTFAFHRKTTAQLIAHRAEKRGIDKVPLLC